MKRSMISFSISFIITLIIINTIIMINTFNAEKLDANRVTKVSSFRLYEAVDFYKDKDFNQELNKLDLNNTEQAVQEVNTQNNIDSDNIYFNGDIKVPKLEHTGVNEDYIGRLSIPQLNIEDGLYYSGDDYYLRTSKIGKPNIAGELYIDGRSPGDLFQMDNLINGHSMKNGTKFGTLLNIDQINEPVYIFINDYDSNKTFIYEVFSVNLVDNKDSGIYLSFGSLYERSIYYQKLVDSSKITTNISDFSNNILTLNTCDYDIKDGHLIVSAILKGWK